MKILILNGHDNYGNGGAASMHGSEQVLNRAFSQIVRDKLNIYGHEATVWNPNITDMSMYTYLKSNDFNFKPWDLVLELHFNAKTYKDPQGNGQFTGTGFYYPALQSDRTIAEKVCRAADSNGFKQWAIVGRGDLAVCNRVYNQGVQFLLWEIAFIDDGDDMKFFLNNQERMATWLADAVGRVNTSEYEAWVGHVVRCENDTLTVRTKPDSSSSVLGSYPALGQGNQVDVIGEEFAPNGRMWYKIRIAGRHIGYVNASYLFPDNGSWVGQVHVANVLNVRKTPIQLSDNIYKPHPQLGNGNLIDVIGQVGEWYRIRIRTYDGKDYHVAYAHKDYIK